MLLELAIVACISVECVADVIDLMDEIEPQSDSV